MKNNLLFRQIHPCHFLMHGLSSAAFRPRKNENDNLSVDCSSIFTAQESYDLYRQTNDTDGTWAITRQNCAILNLDVNPSPTQGGTGKLGNPAHHDVNFSKISSKADKNEAAKKLRDEAVEIGKQWP